MKPHLLIFTIGPVQSFIASARKTQDLFAGSAILSELVQKAYCRLVNAFGEANCDLVFPKLRGCQFENSNEKFATNPNRFAVIIKNIEKERLLQTVNEVKQKVIMEDFRDAGWEIINQGTDMNMPGYGKEQLANLPEIFWAALPLEKVENGYANYHTQYDQLENCLGAIKNERPLKQGDEPGGRKCSVDGIHNVALYRKVRGENNRPYKIFFNQSPNQNDPVVIEHNDDVPDKVPIWQISPGEGLSAISFYKRKFNFDPHDYPSTARVSLMHLYEKVKDWKEVKDFEEWIKGNFGHSDDQLYYEENINRSVFSNTGLFEENKLGQKLKEAHDLHKKIIDKIDKENINEPFTKYYALIIFDGDRMGEWMSGDKLKDKRTLLSFQKKLKELLSEFAIAARSILQEPDGKTVYAAGEDFLGFVNLHALFNIMNLLRTKFDEVVNKGIHATNKEFEIQPNNDFTFSAGIAIAHYKQPLPTVLEEARYAEQQAKKHNQNSGDHFSISIMRHSGGTTRCTLPFGPPICQNVGAMSYIVSTLGNKSFSRKFITTLIREMRYWPEADPRALFDLEVRRLLKRAVSSALNEDDKEKAVDDMALQIGIISKKNGTATRITQTDLKNTLDTLRICDFIHRTTKKEKDAQPQS